MTTTCNLGSIPDIIVCTTNILNSIIPIIVALIVVWVIWSAFQFARSEDADRSKWRNSIVWGIVGLFVAVSIYGLVNILSGTFFDNGVSPNSVNPVGVGKTYIIPPPQN